ncbi:MAG: hypothetical protein BWY85_02159 [Firmicutes bacterium ADurb.Bin506]|nr:MAG: hypothetical protein BWY85_02159 [Firmicutes bacterium ADurb.Bin506]
MGDHDYEALFGHFFDEVHDLNAGGGVEGARGFVAKKDLRIVGQGPGDGDSLHLPARELVGLLVQVVAEPYLL